MNSYRVTEAGLKIRAALQQMLAGTEHSHFVTLNFHADYTAKQAEAALRLWSLDVLDRLFRGAAFREVPTPSLVRFVALPEYTKAGHPHYHLLLWLHLDRRAWFNRCAGHLWRRIVSSGTSDVQQLGDTDLDRAKVITYATKHASRPFSCDNFITSNMLYLPEFIRGNLAKTAPSQSDRLPRSACRV